MAEQPFDPTRYMRRVGGNDYLEVKWRLVWLRDQHPDAEVATDCLEASENHARFRAIVQIPGGGSASGHGSETRGDFPDFYEKAETKAVGRALAMLGYGTQFAPELDEGARIVDSPVQRGPAPPAERKQPMRPIETPMPPLGPQQQRPTPGPGAMTEAQGKRLWVLAKNQNMSEDDTRAQVFLRFGKRHIHEMTKAEASKLMDFIEAGDFLQGAVPTERADPQEANQQGYGVPEEPEWLRQAPGDDRYSA